MTIDVGYAHLAFDDGPELDFVDVPGHDRLVGNMLVGAGEIDAAMLVVAADDGPRAQTIEHLALLDALGIRDGIAVVTKAGMVDAGPRGRGPSTRSAACWPGRPSPDRRCWRSTRRREPACRGCTMPFAPLPNGSLPRTTRDPPAAPRVAPRRRPRLHGQGTRARRDRHAPRSAARARSDARGRAGSTGSARIREVQVHGRAVEAAPPGRTALNVAGVEADALRRGARPRVR